jgi:hypothetical protein
MTIAKQLPNTWALLSEASAPDLPAVLQAVLRDLTPTTRHGMIPEVVAKLGKVAPDDWAMEAIEHLTWAMSESAPKVSALTLARKGPEHPLLLPYPLCVLTIDVVDRENPSLQQATLEGLHHAWCGSVGDDPVSIRARRQDGVLIVVVHGGAGRTPDLYAVAARATEGLTKPEEQVLGVLRVLLDRALRDVADGKISRGDALSRALDPLARMVSSTRAAVAGKAGAWRAAFGTFDRTRAYDAFRAELRGALEAAMRLIERSAGREADGEAALGHLREAASVVAFRVFFITAIEGRRLLYKPGFTPRYYFRGLAQVRDNPPDSCFLLLQELTAAIRGSRSSTGRSRAIPLAVSGASIFANRPNEQFASEVEAWLADLDAGTRGVEKDPALLRAWDGVVARFSILATGQIRHYESAAGREESDVSVGGAAHAQRVLGDVYEQILAMTPLAEGTGAARVLRLVPPGSTLLQADATGDGPRSKAERRSLGAHYTPESLVLEVVRAAVEPVFAGAWARAQRDPEAYVRELLDLRVLDPAMGSAHFLTVAALEIAREIAWAERFRRPRQAEPRPVAEQLKPPAPFEFIVDPNHWQSLPEETRSALDLRAAAVLGVVAQRCCFGVDIAPLAVELGKLALWQLTMVERKARGLSDEARAPSLTFLDANLRCGDSLLGARWEEVAALCHELQLEGADGDLFGQKSASVKGAVALIQHLEPLLGGDPVVLRAALERSRARIATEITPLPEALPSDDHGLRLLAFEVLQHGKSHYRWLWDLAFLRAWYSAGGGDAAMREALKLPSTRSWAAIVGVGAPDEAQRRARTHIRAEALRLRALHWELEFYDVFHRPAGGFDLIVANPPFLGDRNLRAARSEQGVRYLRDRYTQGATPDLCGFFVRSFHLRLSPTRGVFGTVAPNTIAQAKNRETTLVPLVAGTSPIFEIYRSCQSRPWPGDAAVHVATLHLRRVGNAELRAETRRVVQVVEEDSEVDVDVEGDFEEDDSGGAHHQAEALAVVPLGGAPDCSFLDGGVEVELQAVREQSTLAYIGMFARGKFDRPLEFVEQVPPSERRAIYAYLNNRDIQQQAEPRARRVIIDVYDALVIAGVSESPAREQEQWLADHMPTLYRELKQTVSPFREKLPDSYSNKKARSLWWQFANVRPGLRESWRNQEEILAIGGVGKVFKAFVLKVRDPVTGCMISPTHQLCILPTVSSAVFGVLSSLLLETQVRRSCSSLETRLRFTPTQVFPYFPFPWKGQPTGNPNVAPVLNPPESVERRLGPSAKALLALRHELLTDPARHGLAPGEFRGPTALYNAFDNPTETRTGILALRAAHRVLEAAVLAEYGWSDLADEARWTFDRPWIDGTWRYVPNVETRRTYLARLAELNRAQTARPASKKQR